MDRWSFSESIIIHEIIYYYITLKNLYKSWISIYSCSASEWFSSTISNEDVELISRPLDVTRFSSSILFWLLCNKDVLLSSFEIFFFNSPVSRKWTELFKFLKTYAKLMKTVSFFYSIKVTKLKLTQSDRFFRDPETLFHSLMRAFADYFDCSLKLVALAFPVKKKQTNISTRKVMQAMKNIQAII